jgi:hypothetical protein
MDMFKDIVTYNTDVPMEITNESIMKSVKKNLDKNLGFVDIMELYNKE